MAFRITLVKSDGALPIHRQIVNSVRHAISSGRLKAGDRLPPVRELASELDVAMNTVARAYRDLDREGLTDNAAGRGTFVRQLMVPHAHRWATDASAAQMLRPALMALMAMGLNRTEIAAAVERLLGESPLKVGVVASSTRGAEKWAQALQSELKECWIEAIPVRLDDLEADREAVLRRFDDVSFVFTLLTGYHLAREMFEGTTKQVVPLITQITHRTQQELLALPRGTRIGLVCEDVYLNSVLEIVGSYTDTSNIERVRNDDIEGVWRLADTVDVLLYTFAAGEVVEKLPAISARLIPLVYTLSEENLAHIRELIVPHAPPHPAAPAPAPAAGQR
jgi:GntR family transcriptional regulator